MKKLFFVLLMTLCFLTACSSKNNENTNPSAPIKSADSVDVDLTKLSSTMVYSEVYNMMVTPDRYTGKIVKMKGQFAFYEDPDTKNQYFACIIADAAACCSQGLEFILTGEHTYPDDYPDLGNEITVIGTFEMYEDNGIKYCRLVNATLEN